MKALIFNNKVVDVKETEFPVHNSMTWANCGDEVKIGFSYNGSTLISKLKALGLSSSEIDALTGR